MSLDGALAPASVSSQAKLSGPERLSGEHDVSQFDNGRHPALDDWLKHRALASEGLSARTYVAATREERREVVAYYAITAAMADLASLPTAKLRKNMPTQVPLMLIGRLAVDRRRQGKGLGRAMLIDALRRILDLSESAGVRAAAVTAIDDAAESFYLAHRFKRSPTGARIMFLPTEEIRDLLIPPS